MGGPAHTHQALDSPARWGGSPILWPLRMDRVGGARLQVGEVPSRGCLSRGPSRHLVRTWPPVPTAQPGRLGGHLSGRLPPFSCERQAGRDRGLGTAICSGSSLCRDLGPTGGVEGEGWRGSRQKVTSGRGRLCRAGLLRHHLCPAPPDGLGSAPSGAPSPPPGQAAPTQWHPATPRGSRGARVCPPGHPASVTGRPALGTVPGNYLWVTRRLPSPGTPSSTDLAWTLQPGRPRSPLEGAGGDSQPLPSRGRPRPQEGRSAAASCRDSGHWGGLHAGFGCPRVRMPPEHERV